MSRMTDEYGEFKQTHADFLNGVFEARARLQKMFKTDVVLGGELLEFRFQVVEPNTAKSSTWFEEAVEFANAIYPSGIMAVAMQSIRTRALNTGGEMQTQPWSDLLRPSRASECFRVKAKPKTQVKHDAMSSLKKDNIIGNFKMSKTNDFVTSIKGIFGATVRMQRGRATVHAVKRIIFKAFPIQWGILARLTGKAKKVEDHPLTDVAVALLAHGAASALLTDPKKRDKYLCYTEEMVAASVANAGLKMVPVEDILDKVLNGAMDSEAISKLKAVLQDQ